MLPQLLEVLHHRLKLQFREFLVLSQGGEHVEQVDFDVPEVWVLLEDCVVGFFDVEDLFYCLRLHLPGVLLDFLNLFA